MSGLEFRTGEEQTFAYLMVHVMDSVVYQDILDRNFIPFVEERFPDGYRLYQVHAGYTCNIIY